MKAYGRMEVEVHAFLNWTQDGRLCRFVTSEEPAGKNRRLFEHQESNLVSQVFHSIDCSLYRINYN